MKKKIVSLCLCAALLAVAVIGGTLAYFTDVTDEVNNTFTMGNVDITLDEAKVNDAGKVIDPTDRVQENIYKKKMVPGYVFDKDPTIHVSTDSEESYLFLDVAFNKYNSLCWVMAADASEDKTIDFDMFTRGEDGKITGLQEAFKNNDGVFSSTAFMTAMSKNKEVFHQIIAKWITGIKHEDWQVMENPFTSSDDAHTTLVFRLGYIGNAGTDVAGENFPFMTNFQMPASVTEEIICMGAGRGIEGRADYVPNIGKMQNNFSGTLNLDFLAYAIQAEGFDTIEAAYASGAVPFKTYTK